MKITRINFEETVNRITIEYVIEIGKIKERIEKCDWMSKEEIKDCFPFVDFKLMHEIVEFVKVHKKGNFNKGTTQGNMIDQFTEFMRLAKLLRYRGEEK